MIGPRPGTSRRAFNRIEAIGLRTVPFDAAPRGKRTGVFKAGGAGAEKVGVERQNDRCLFDGVLRVRVLAEGELTKSTSRLPLHKNPVYDRPDFE